MPHPINFIEMVAAGGRLPEVLVGTWFVMALLIIFALFARRALAKAADPLMPEEGVTFRSVCETVVEALAGFVQDTIEVHHARDYIGFFGALFLFILAANFLGLIPGMEPPTNDSDLTFALGALCFIFYLWQGFRYKGLAYLRDFLGPVWWLIPLMLPIEVADNLFRPFSLGVRLDANMLADHTVLGIFTGMTKLLIPVALLALGSIVCVVQAGVFMILGMAYVRMALRHDH